MGAIQYAQRYLVESEGMSKEKLQETMVLLAFKPSTECEKYKVCCRIFSFASPQNFEEG